MIKINYYIPPKDKTVRQERVIGDGKVTITQGEKEDSFNLNDVNDTSIEIETVIPDDYAKKEDIGEAIINFEMTNPSQVGTNQSFNVNQNNDSTIKIPNYTNDINNINSIIDALRYTYNTSISKSYGYKFYDSASYSISVKCTAYKADNTDGTYKEFNAYISKNGGEKISMSKLATNVYEYTEALTSSVAYNIYSDSKIIGSYKFTMYNVGYVYIGVVSSSELSYLMNNTNDWLRNRTYMYEIVNNATINPSNSYRINPLTENFYIFIAVARGNSGLVDINKPLASTYNSTKHDDFLSSGLTYIDTKVINDKNYEFYLSPELVSENTDRVPVYIKFQ